MPSAAGLAASRSLLHRRAVAAKRNSSLVHSPASQRAWCRHKSAAACRFVLGSEQSRARTPLGHTRPCGSHRWAARLQARPNVLAPFPCFVTKGSRRRHLSMNRKRKSERNDNLFGGDRENLRDGTPKRKSNRLTSARRARSTYQPRARRAFVLRDSLPNKATRRSYAYKLTRPPWPPFF
jgi:hypothetical protein